ncbi:MAG: carbohydrate kinase family protein [Candidatus Atribacteria bacterium]|nr:carbohydrate kinase family protein [Candidatus Atribacteria bacterium]
MFDVACVGIACADVLVKPISRFPERGKLSLVEELTLQAGGCALNAAIDLARLGVATTIVSKVGDDGFGRYLLETLQKEGVDTRGVVVDPSTPTSASVVLIDEVGERSIVHLLGTNARFTAGDIDPDVVRSSRILFIAGTFLMPLFDGEGTMWLSRAAREANVMVCMDTAWDSSGQWLRKIEGALPYLHWFMPSYEEAKALSGHSHPEAIARFFISRGVENVVIKLGEKGCYVASTAENAAFYAPSYRLERVVDTSGAGDAFCAGFIAGLLSGFDVYRCARFANAVAAHCIMEIGTTRGVKERETILRFMNENR